MCALAGRAPGESLDEFDQSAVGFELGFDVPLEIVNHRPSILRKVFFAVVHHVVGHGFEPEFSEEDGQHLAGLRGVDLVSFHSFGLSIF